VREQHGWVRALLSLMALLAAGGVSAQQAPALVGHVRTPQRLPVPGATIRVESISTHQAWVTWTDSSGQFQFPHLPEGSYQLTCSMLGFQDFASTIQVPNNAGLEIVLHVVTLAELEPKPKPAEVASGGPPAQEASAGSSSSARAARAATAGRRAPASAVLNAARVLGGFQQVEVMGEEASGEVQPGSGESSIGLAAAAQPLGEAASSDAFLMAGSVARTELTTGLGEMGWGGPQNVRGPAGPIGGFPGAPGGGGPAGGRGGFYGGRRGGFGPGPGRRGPPQGGSLAELWARRELLQRSINRVRFNLTNRLDNSIWDARPYSLTGAAVPQTDHYDENFNASLGGPFRLPHLYDGRDRTFFFVNFGLEHQRSPVDAYATVPTAPERAGNFCDRPVQLYDPLSNLAGPRTALGCQIPASRLDPAAVGLLQFVPLPNLPGLVQNYHLQTTVPVSTERVNARVVHTLSPRLSLQAIYNLQAQQQHLVSAFPTLTGRTLVRNQNVELGLTQNWTPRLVHQTTLNFNRSRTDTRSDHAYGDDIAAALGITGISLSPRNDGVPLIDFTNFTSLDDPIPQLVRNQTWRFDDSVTLTLRQHTLQGGLELRRMDWNRLGDPLPRGQFTFTGLMTSQLDAQGRPIPGTGFDLADFLLGLPQSTSVRFGSSASYFRSWGFVGYFQDDWRLHPRFTLDLGVRYDLATPPVELFNAIANLDLSPGITQVAVVTPGQAGPWSGPLPRSLIRTDANNWAPRIGFAWQPLPQASLIVRGGYSIFYNESIYQQLAFELANQPPFAQAQVRFTTSTQVLTLENGFPPAPSVKAKNTMAVDPNYRVGYAQIWDFGLEQQIAGGWLWTVFYTGTKGTHLDLQRAPNRAPPGSPLTTDLARRIADASGFIYDTFGASSIYHALRVSVRKRPTHGLMVVADYTFGKSIDNASTIGGGSPVVVQDDTNFRAERGLSSFDVRHQLRLMSFYELPFGDRKRWARSGWAGRLLGNYRLSGVLTANSGTPYTARVLGNQAENTGTGTNFSERADQVGDPCAGEHTTLAAFNLSAFALPPPGRYGNAARNTICGPRLINLDLSVDRWFLFGRDRQRRLDVRWETHNLLNTPNFSGINTVVNSATYGRVTGVRPMRTMDLVVRVSF
jgi:hypothetical protein